MRIPGISMLHDAKVCFEDAINAAFLIQEFTKDLNFDQYELDIKTQSAVERQFEIIGEAFNRIFKIDSELLTQITDWKDIIGFRNVIIHGYDVLSTAVIWDTVCSNIPQLIKDLKPLI